MQTRSELLLSDNNGVVAGVIELKGLTRSASENLNDRTGETLGSAVDIDEAIVEGLHGVGVRPPIICYALIVQRDAEVLDAVRTARTEFPANLVFENANRADRLVRFARRMVQKRAHQAIWLSACDTESGAVPEPDQALSYAKMIKAIGSEPAVRAA